MRGTPVLIALGIVAAAIAFSGQPTPPQAEAAPVAHDYAADIARLQGELDTLRDERDELRAAYQARDAEAREYQNDRDRLLLKQSSLTPAASPSVSAPRAVTYVSAGARGGVCANGSCGQRGRVYYVPRQPSKQEPVQYQARGRFRDGTGWRPGKILLGR